MTDVRLVKDCGLYPNYKKIIDFTGSKSQIITKQLEWIDGHDPYNFQDVNYNKLQNKLVLPLDYEDALTYTYAVLTDISGSSSNRPLFMFINEIENLTGGDDSTEPSVGIIMSLDPIMTFMGEWELDECMINRSHVDRWQDSKIKRITPTQEGVVAFNKTVAMHDLSNLTSHSAFGLCVITFTSPYQKLDIYTGVDEWTPEKEFEHAVYQGVFLVDLSNPDRQLRTKVDFDIDITIGLSNFNITENSMLFPSLKQIIDGLFQSELPVVDQAIISFTLSPITLIDLDTETINGEVHYNLKDYVPKYHVDWRNTDSTNLDYSDFQMIMDYSKPLKIDANNQVTEIDLSEQTCVIFKDVTDIQSDYIDMTVNWSLPTPPVDGATKDKIYEPALYMSPYMTRKVVKGDGTVLLEIPDINIESRTIRGKQVINSAGITNMFTHLGSSNGEIYDIANGEMSLDSSVILDVVNDEWKTYVYTSRDTDRQMVSNQIWKNAIDNLIYMSYGGTLVGSRSLSEGFTEKVKHDNFVQRSNPRKGTSWTVNNPYYTTELTKGGRRVASATGIAAGASIITSLVDAHVMWENQLQKEKQIRNQPSSILSVGDGISSVLNGYHDYYVAEQRVDDINYDKAYETFWKYGYWINKFEQPDINSRKYFNYILTNGAIVKGSVNQEIRDVIGSIFDSGVTVFHYDSEDDVTRNLEYTDKENIETSLLNVFRATIPEVDEDQEIEASFVHE